MYNVYIIITSVIANYKKKKSHLTSGNNNYDNKILKSKIFAILCN